MSSEQLPDANPTALFPRWTPPSAWDRPKQPDTPRRSWKVPLFLFLATCASTCLVGGWIYSVCLMTILLCHEFGHFLQARRYHVPASFPHFIPVPVKPLGTFGAVIAMSPEIPNRRAVFDIGITGPLAGLVPTLIFCVVGLHFSDLVTKKPDPNIIELGKPLLFQFLAWLEFGHIPEGKVIDFSFFGFIMAGWVGLLVTSLNLFPIGQLDGGHVLYALLRTRAHTVAKCVLGGAIVAVILLGYFWWFLMLGLVVMMGPKHPPTENDEMSLGATRTVLGWLTLAFLIVGFTPNPFSLNTSGLAGFLMRTWPW